MQREGKISFNNSSAFSLDLLKVIATEAPQLAASMASERPKPLEAPVIKTFSLLTWADSNVIAFKRRIPLLQFPSIN